MKWSAELVLVRNRLSTLKATMADEEGRTRCGNLGVVTADLQLSVMKTRMQPVKKKVFGRFPRVVRDLARNLKKRVDLVLNGETDLDKNLVEAFRRSASVHLAQRGRPRHRVAR